MLGVAAALSNHDGVVTTEKKSRVATGGSPRRWRGRWALRGKGALLLVLQHHLSLVGYHNTRYLGVSTLLAASRYFDLARLKSVFGVHMIVIRCSRADF